MSPSRNTKSRSRVLVIQDPGKRCNGIVNALKEKGVDASEGYCGPNYLDVVREHNAVIAEINMSWFNGIEMTAEIRAAGISTPIILIAEQGFGYEKEALASGADLHIERPLFIPRLLEEIDRLLDCSSRSLQMPKAALLPKISPAG